MNTAEIEVKVRKSLEDGTVHHLYNNELRAYHLLSMPPDELRKLLADDFMEESAVLYSDILGPNRIRSIKNGVISYLTLVCRTAISAGTDPEFSYALSDYYINYMETLSSEQELRQLLIDITLHYNDLINRTPKTSYSRQVTSALRYMQQRLYGKLSVKEIAKSVSLEPHYFAELFRKETGKTPSYYFQEMKIQEARRLLRLPGNTVTYVATVLGYSDSAHFSKRFKQLTGVNPREYQKKGGIL